MSTEKSYGVKPEIAQQAHIDEAGYRELYASSIEDPDRFWAGQASRFVEWLKPWQTVKDCDFATGHVRWFEGAQLNVSHNCLDRHLDKRGGQTAIIWEGDDPAMD